MQLNRIIGAAASAIGAILFHVSAVPAGAVTLASLEQNRHASGMSFFSPCTPSAIVESETATDFEPFDVVVTVAHDCEAAGGLAVASQQSAIVGNAMVASGQVQIQADASSPTEVHIVTDSDFELTFEIDAFSRALMTGTLSATGPVPNSSANAQIRDERGTILASHIVPLLPEGTDETMKFSETLQLPPGVYTVWARARSTVSATVPPVDARTAAFDISFEVYDLADLNFDSVVNGIDLGILLANWSIPAGEPGCAGAKPCASDINGDGVVDGIDLGILLTNWSL